jgi:hypothetical protein
MGTSKKPQERVCQKLRFCDALSKFRKRIIAYKDSGHTFTEADIRGNGTQSFPMERKA